MAIKQYIILVIIMLNLSLAFAKDCDKKVFIINFAYDKDSHLNYNSFSEGVGCYPYSDLRGSSIFEIKKDGITYYDTSFDYKVIYTDVFDGNAVVGGPKKAYNTEFSLVVPYNDNIDGFEVKEGNASILSVDKTTFYSKSQGQTVQGQGLFDWVDSLMRGLFGTLFS